MEIASSPGVGVRGVPVPSCVCLSLSLGIPCDTAFDFLAGQFPIPTIWAEPDSVVTKGQSVTIWCFGTEEAQVYYLYKKEGSKSLKPQTVFEPGNKANFSIPFTTEYHAGRYHCYYYSPNVSWTQNSQKHPNGHFLALFPVGPVTSKHRWAFRCYGYYKSTSQMWSVPSEILQLLLSDSHSQDHTVENLIRMAVAGLILVVLGILLFEAQKSQRSPQDAEFR
uniref:Ig-like domain-containing protein n=1 Tax=Peromyscus maniculatus bairdii TaxID=230844 RepID=A0A8C8W7T7_PERMB